MFKNVGEKLKKWAIVCFVINLIAAITLLVLGILQLDSGFDGGWIYIIGAVMLAVLALFESWLLYAFGQITDDVHKMANASHEEQKPAEDEIPEI